MGHYPVMKDEELFAMAPMVDSLAEKNCYLYMWATCPKLVSAVALGNAWGFTFRTVAYVWVKVTKNSQILSDRVCVANTIIGCGSHERSNTELCLLFGRGSVKRVDATVPQVIFAPRRQHSRKPDEARQRIMRCRGDIPRIELFAREAAPGWDVWGNETTKFTEPIL
jgi:N6-adenosine-specific RNA methylase IME4